MTIYYVYRITNKILNKHYYGKRRTKTYPRNDLGIKYFSSSTDKDFVSDQKNNPDNYRYKIIFVTTKKEIATRLEIKLHAKFDVAKNPNFYNKAKQLSLWFDTTGTKLNYTPEERLKRSLRWSGENNPNHFRDSSGENNPMYGVHRFGSNNPFFGKIHTEETRKKISNANSGIVRSEEVRKALSLSRKDKPKRKMLCPYCGCEMDIRNMKVHHIPKCSLNLPNLENTHDQG